MECTFPGNSPAVSQFNVFITIIPNCYDISTFYIKTPSIDIFQFNGNLNENDGYYYYTFDFVYTEFFVVPDSSCLINQQCTTSLEGGLKIVSQT